ncbi:Uncharacterised protein [Bordetella pertussis]|nr:Uncharacterised protein [Bordetella pertussis]CFW37670.1 Uncharacterised protein [Bordetella pertussis]
MVPASKESFLYMETSFVMGFSNCGIPRSTPQGMGNHGRAMEAAPLKRCNSKSLCAPLHGPARALGVIPR